MLFVNGVPTECFSTTWDAAFFGELGVEIGVSASQTYLEVLAMILAVEKWCSAAGTTAVFGDNQGALQEALDLKGRGCQDQLAQLLAVLRYARSLDLVVAHLPTESNDEADALSRQAGPQHERKPWPFPLDRGVRRVAPIGLRDLWAWLQPEARKKRCREP